MVSSMLTAGPAPPRILAVTFHLVVTGFENVTPSIAESCVAFVFGVLRDWLGRSFAAVAVGNARQDKNANKAIAIEETKSLLRRRMVIPI